VDLASIIGLVLAFGCVAAGVLLEGGHLGSFVSLSSFCIVIGGSTGATVIGSAMGDVKRLPLLIVSVVKPAAREWEETVKEMVELAGMARRDGLLSLESYISVQKDDFIRAGLRLIVDGADSEVLHHVLETRLEAVEEEGKRAEKMFEQLGGFCPTLGIVGTVTGLIHVLGNLSEPDKLGESIAVAFIATLYGIGFANLVFLPCANKLKLRSETSLRYYRMIIAGLTAVQAGENPLATEEKMRSFITEAVKPGKEGGNGASSSTGGASS
jgi:chemotaxis protein MotA